MRYPVYETFHSWQGEGVHLGKSTFFIRLFGCPVHCPWCDSAGTWHPDYVPDRIEKIEAAELADFAAKAKPDLVVVTGGEPVIHDLECLTDALETSGLSRHLETSGCHEISGDWDWITLSPKRESPPVESALNQANEFKVIVDSERSIDEWTEFLSGQIDSRPIWLHPEWSQHSNAEILNRITEFVKERGSPFRAGVQAHKYYQADILDPSSAKPNPLGGNPKLGY